MWQNAQILFICDKQDVNFASNVISSITKSHLKTSFEVLAVTGDFIQVKYDNQTITELCVV